MPVNGCPSTCLRSQAPESAILSERCPLSYRKPWRIGPDSAALCASILQLKRLAQRSLHYELASCPVSTAGPATKSSRHSRSLCSALQPCTAACAHRATPAQTIAALYGVPCAQELGRQPAVQAFHRDVQQALPQQRRRGQHGKAQAEHCADHSQHTISCASRVCMRRCHP